MPFDSQGIASISGQRPVNGQDTDAAQINVPLNDIQSMLSQVLLRSGVAPMTGNLNMNGFRVTGLPDASNSQDPATYAQLQSIQAIVDALVPVGTVCGFEWKDAPPGWVKRRGGTIGNAASGASTRANADTQRLFVHYWNTFNNTEKPILNSNGTLGTRGANALADFNANKRMPLWDSRTRFHRGADDGLGFDVSLMVGASQDDALKEHSHTGNITLGTATIPTTIIQASSTDNLYRGGSFDKNISASIPNIPYQTGSTGIPLETRPRSSVLLYCVKL
jgi:hypothetical protein